MQKKILNVILLQLRIAAALLVLTLLTALLLSFRTQKAYADIWQQLGISREKGLHNIEASFLNGYFHYYGAEKARNLLSGDRSVIAKDLLVYTRQQVMSESFKKQYEQMRQQAKPQAPQRKLRSKEEIRKEKITETEASIKQAEATIKAANADMAKALKPMMEVLQNNLKDYRSPNSNMIDLFYQGEQYNLQSEQRQYEERQKQWEYDYPADYRHLVRRRLQQFIDLAATVDFNAELKTVGSKKKFVNPKYEGKASDWKMIYRAGKEVITPALAFAEQWVAELK